MRGRRSTGNTTKGLHLILRIRSFLFPRHPRPLGPLLPSPPPSSFHLFLSLSPSLLFILLFAFPFFRQIICLFFHFPPSPSFLPSFSSLSFLPSTPTFSFLLFLPPPLTSLQLSPSLSPFLPPSHPPSTHSPPSTPSTCLRVTRIS